MTRRKSPKLSARWSALKARISRTVSLTDWELDGALDTLFWDKEPLPEGTPHEQAVYLLCHARHVVVFIGSGLSADSGVATFRGQGSGIYQLDVPDLDVAALTHRDTFLSPARSTQLTWHQRWREVVGRAPISAGHHALVSLAQRGGYTLVTQNVDGLIERAARQRDLPVELIHLHGELEQVRCDACHTRQAAGRSALDALPPCRVCGGVLRPDVVWFGEALDEALLARARHAAQRAEVCMLVGTSALVYPAAAIPEVAQRSGARLIEINVAETALTEHCDVVLRQGASLALGALVEALRRASPGGPGGQGS